MRSEQNGVEVCQKMQIGSGVLKIEQSNVVASVFGPPLSWHLF